MTSEKPSGSIANKRPGSDQKMTTKPRLGSETTATTKTRLMTAGDEHRKNLDEKIMINNSKKINNVKKEIEKIIYMIKTVKSL